MVSELNAIKQEQKKIRSFLQCFEGRQFSCGVFSEIITLKIWQTTAEPSDQLAWWRKSGKHLNWEKLEWAP